MKERQGELAAAYETLKAATAHPPSVVLEAESAMSARDAEIIARLPLSAEDAITSSRAEKAMHDVQSPAFADALRAARAAEATRGRQLRIACMRAVLLLKWVAILDSSLTLQVTLHTAKRTAGKQ
jgi:hypothetical protein